MKCFIPGEFLSLPKNFLYTIVVFFLCCVNTHVFAATNTITQSRIDTIINEVLKTSNIPINIKVALKHKQLKQVLEGVINLKDGKIGEILQKFSGADSNWVWIIKEGHLTEGINATTRRSNDGIVSIFDYHKLKGASKISIARTFIHELVHTYLLLYFRWDENASNEYPNIKKDWLSNSNPDLNEIHHAEMARSFIYDIALALKEYGYSIGQRVDDSIYNDLAWAGLDYEDNNELKEKDKERIQQRIDTEQLGATTLPSF